MAVQKKQVSIVLALVLLGVALLGYVVPDLGTNLPQRLLLDNAGGPVVFAHADHATRLNIACTTCHHDSAEQPEKVQSCSACHGIRIDAAFRQDHQQHYLGNESCATCHHYEFDRRQWGHRAHTRIHKVRCRSCHHTRDVEPKPMNCVVCHDDGAPDAAGIQPDIFPNFGTAVHGRCATCHKERFGQGVQGCAQCHTQRRMRDHLPATGQLKVSPAYANCATCHGQPAEKMLPGRMEAMHKLCMGCHEKRNQGPFGKENCAQCHTGK